MYTRRALPGLMLWLVAASAFGLGPAVTDVRITTPRDYGYLIGDKVSAQIRFDLADGYELDVDTLPRPARVTRWLALVDVDFNRQAFALGAARHEVTFTYQVVNASPDVLDVGIPPQPLSIIGPDDSFPVLVPAWGFSIAPITQDRGRAQGTLPQLHAALPPPKVDTQPRVLRIALLLVVLAACATVLAYIHWMLPWVARTSRPFSRAARTLTRELRRDPGIPQDRVLAQVHRAFDQIAGRVVFEHELERFFTEHPVFVPLRDDIVRLYEHSGKRFYSRDPEADSSAIDAHDLLWLCRQCALLERGL